MIESDRSKDLLTFLRFMADHQITSEIETCADMLHEIYSDPEFRHQYSLLYPLFVEITSELKSKKSDKIAIIVQNLEGVIESCEGTDKYSDRDVFIQKVKKLLDHVSLEYQRLQCMQDLEESIEVLSQQIQDTHIEYDNHRNEVENLKRSVAESQIQSDTLQGTFKKIDKKVQDLESNVLSQIIAVLGIFVAIVVACFGTMEILGNVSALLAEHIPLYKVLVAFFVMALAFMDILALLIYFIGRLCGKPISAPCKYGSCDNCERKKGKCNGWGHFIHSQYHLIITNGALVVMIVLTIILLPSVERNIDKKYYTETTVIAEETQEPETETEWATEFQTEPADTSTQNE
jgi:hypothetical protein